MTAKTKLAWLLIVMTVASVACWMSTADASIDLQCGRVPSKYGRFRVDIVGGHVRCTAARRVIHFVLTHGPATQGAPGKSPSHWTCGWGYGYYHGHRNQSGRSGPLCTRGSREVEGTGPGFTLKPTHRDVVLHSRRTGSAYLACDNANEPDYPALRAAPRSCSLGLGESLYDAQPVPGHRQPHAVALKDLKWHRWGRRSARAHGRVCNVYSSRCQRARVILSKPRRILPAGNRLIYQLIRVRHFPRGGRPYTDWYEPGTDY